MNLTSLIPSVAAPQVSPSGRSLRDGSRASGETPDVDGIRSNADHSATEDEPDFADDLESCLEAQSGAPTPGSPKPVDAPPPAPVAEKSRNAKALLEDLFPALNPLMGGGCCCCCCDSMAAAVIPGAAQALPVLSQAIPTQALVHAGQSQGLPSLLQGETALSQGAPVIAPAETAPVIPGAAEDPIVFIDGAALQSDDVILAPAANGNKTVVGPEAIAPEIITTPTTPTTPTEGAANISVLREETPSAILSDANMTQEPKAIEEKAAFGSDVFGEALSRAAQTERPAATLEAAVTEVLRRPLTNDAETSRSAGPEVPSARQETVQGIVPAAGPSADLAPAAPRAPAVANQVGHAILTRAELIAREGKTEFHLQLDPPELGSVRVHLTATDHSVSARLVVHEDSARQLLESQLHSLRQRLEEAGIHVGRFDVMHDHSGWQNQPQQHQPSAPFSPSGTAPAGWSREDAPRIPEAVSSSRRLVDVLV